MLSPFHSQPAAACSTFYRLSFNSSTSRSLVSVSVVMSSPSTSPLSSPTPSAAPEIEISPISFTPGTPATFPSISRTSSPRPKLCPLDALQCSAPRVRKATSWPGQNSKSASTRPQVILPPIAKFAPARASVTPAPAPAPLSPVSPQISWPVYQARFRGCMTVVGSSPDAPEPRTPLSARTPREMHRRARILV